MPRGSHDHTTRDAVLTYLRVDPAPVSIRAITKYMRQMHRVDSGAVRECLRRLAREGHVVHVERGIYQIGNRAPAELPTQAGALTNGLQEQARG